MTNINCIARPAIEPGRALIHNQAEGEYSVTTFASRDDLL